MSGIKRRAMKKGQFGGRFGLSRKQNSFGRVGIFLLGGVLLTQIGPPPASPQEVPAPAKPLQYEVSVVLKLIHVYVTDKKGNPVKDLAINDFVVTDNGQPVKVTDLEKHILQPAAAGEPKVEERPEAGAELVATPIPAVRPSTRKFFLFFDLAFNNSRGMAKAKKAAFYFLDAQVRPEDEIGVVSYSMFGGVKVHEFLTADHPKVRDAVEKLSQRDSMGRAEEIEDWYWRLVQEPLPGEGGLAQGEAKSGVENPPKVPYYVYEAKAQREEIKRHSQTFILALTTLAKALRYIPDQKQFILFSSGVPSSLIYGNQAGNPSQTTPAGSWGGGSQFDPGDPTLKAMNEAMYREFAVSGCTFYAFDTRESAKGMDLFGYDSRTLETGSRSILNKQSVFQDSNSIMKDDKATGLDFLKRFSDVTGGQYFSNIDKYEKNLDQIQALTGTYYVLGYPINERWDGKFHEVKVQVKRKGYEVRAQVGYFNPKSFSEYSDLEKRLHLFDLALNERASSRMPVSIPMTALSSSAEGITRLAVLAKVPGEVTAKLSGKRVEFIAIFFDGKGEISDVVREETDPASIRGRDMSFAAGATLKPGDYSCRLVIRDMDTGLSAVASAKATVGKPQLTGIQLGTPLVLEARIGGSFLCAGAKKAKAAFPWADIYSYDSSLFSPVLGELLATTASIQVVVPCAIPGGGQPELGLSANLVNSTSGELLPITIARMDRVRKGPLDILTVEIPTAEIAPGTYYLHFYAQDRASGALGHASATLVISRHHGG
jgi:VWFA-related protein